MRRLFVFILILVLAGCQATSLRVSFDPLTRKIRTEVFFREPQSDVPDRETKGEKDAD